MQRIRETFAALIASKDGATAIEYGLIVSLIALGCLGGMQAFGTSLADMWNYVADEVLAVA